MWPFTMRVSSGTTSFLWERGEGKIQLHTIVTENRSKGYLFKVCIECRHSQAAVVERWEIHPTYRDFDSTSLYQALSFSIGIQDPTTLLHSGEGRLHRLGRTPMSWRPSGYKEGMRKVRQRDRNYTVLILKLMQDLHGVWFAPTL